MSNPEHITGPGQPDPIDPMLPLIRQLIEAMGVHPIDIEPGDVPPGPPAVPEATDYDDIIPTAILTAGWRTFSNLPLAKEVAQAATRIWEGDGHDLPVVFEPEKHAPALEIRHRVTDHLINEAGNAQILDIAAGLTSRGMHMAQGESVTYVELDLPVISDLKNRVQRQLQRDGTIRRFGRGDLLLEAGDALDPAAVTRAAQHFNPGEPVTVLTEGLLHYLRRDERAALAQNIHGVLQQAGGGVWITDMPTWEGISDHDREMAQHTSDISGRHVPSLRFETHQEAQEFFAQYGLKLEVKRPFLSVIDELESPSEVGATREEVVDVNAPWSMWMFEFRLADD